MFNADDVVPIGLMSYVANLSLVTVSTRDDPSNLSLRHSRVLLLTVTTASREYDL